MRKYTAYEVGAHGFFGPKAFRMWLITGTLKLFPSNPSRVLSGNPAVYPCGKPNNPSTSSGVSLRMLPSGSRTTLYGMPLEADRGIVKDFSRVDSIPCR